MWHAMGIMGHQQVSGDGYQHWAVGTRRWPALGLRHQQTIGIIVLGIVKPKAFIHL